MNNRSQAATSGWGSNSSSIGTSACTALFMASCANHCTDKWICWWWTCVLIMWRYFSWFRKKQVLSKSVDREVELVALVDVQKCSGHWIWPLRRFMGHRKQTRSGILFPGHGRLPDLCPVLTLTWGKSCVCLAGRMTVEMDKTNNHTNSRIPTHLFLIYYWTMMLFMQSDQINITTQHHTFPLLLFWFRFLSHVVFIFTGAPIVVSFPHFYQADRQYIDAIEGMNPNKEEHETYLDINPVSTSYYRWSDYLCHNATCCSCDTLRCVSNT